MIDSNHSKLFVENEYNFNKSTTVKITTIIESAMKYLHSKQLPWGEFAGFDITKEGKPLFYSNVFVTANILRSLSYVKTNVQKDQMVKQACNFILGQMVSPGYWKYYCKGQQVGLDIDDTSLCLTALIRNGILIKNQEAVIKSLLEYRNENKLFYTWMDTNYDFVVENDIDSVVNANVAELFSITGNIDFIDNVANYLLAESENLFLLHNSQIYYRSPNVFAYVYSKSQKFYSNLDMSHIFEFLNFSQYHDGSWGNTLESGLAINALLENNEITNTVEKGILYLKKTFNKEEKCWPPEFMFFGCGYGSCELTTAICIEALSKYNNINNQK